MLVYALSFLTFCSVVGGTFKKEESPDKSRPSSSMSWSGESPRNFTNISWDSSPRRSRCGSTRCSRYGSGRASISDTSLSTLTNSISISPERQQAYIPDGRRRSCRSGLPHCLKTYLGRQNSNLVCRSRWLLGALASDNSAGQPFRKYLTDLDLNKELQCLGFWNDVRGYLASRDSSNDPRLGEARRLMARDIAERYLSSSKDRCSIFSERLKMSLFRCLVNQSDDTLIFASQDIISEVSCFKAFSYVSIISTIIHCSVPPH